MKEKRGKKGTRALISEYNNQLAKSKRSQITLWIILAIVIVAAIILLFSFRIPQRFIFPSSPTVQLEGCLGNSLDDAVESVSMRGGSINPVNSIMYNGEKVEYLCYTNQYYQTCSQQQPLLKQHVEREILYEIKQEAEKCIASLKEDLRSRGYQVSENKQDISIEIVPNNIKVIFSGFSITKENSGESYSEFEASKKSNLYDLIMLTTSILNWEARYGDADITTYMIYYPNVKVEKYKQEDGSKIYILTDNTNQDKFIFATRSLSWPAGYGYGLTFKPV